MMEDRRQASEDLFGTGYPTHDVSSTVNARLFLGLFLTGTMAISGPHWYNITTKYRPQSGVMSSPNFAKFTGAEDPRQIEVGMWFQF